MGFDNTTRIYIAAGELFGGDRFMKPFRTMFPHLQNHSTVGPSEKLEENARGLVGSAVDYMVCLLSDIFMPTYDGPSNFANNLLGHRLYYGFRTTIQPNRKALAPIFMDREEGRAADFEDRIRQVMFNSKFGGPHKRVHPESFYTNSWPECFCQMSPKDPADKCPPDNIMETLDGQLQNEESDDLDPSNMSNKSNNSASDIPPPANMAPFTPEAAKPRDAKPMKKDAGSFHRAGSPPVHDEGPHHDVTVPPFAGWDENDPASGERYTRIFNVIADNRRNPGTPYKPPTPSEFQQSGNLMAATWFDGDDESDQDDRQTRSHPLHSFPWFGSLCPPPPRRCLSAPKCIHAASKCSKQNGMKIGGNYPTKKTKRRGGMAVFRNLNIGIELITWLREVLFTILLPLRTTTRTPREKKPLGVDPVLCSWLSH
ncbi:hypothetical protein GW17_00010912 [Ensete ventricosum]|nr:hypothetical protein GW17_00010912 [Ensete ventricosum]